jgi:hypothetical protein
VSALKSRAVARLSEKDFVAGTAIQIARVGFKKISPLAAL